MVSCTTPLLERVEDHSKRFIREHTRLLNSGQVREDKIEGIHKRILEEQEVLAKIRRGEYGKKDDHVYPKFQYESRPPSKPVREFMQGLVGQVYGRRK